MKIPTHNLRFPYSLPLFGFWICALLILPTHQSQAQSIRLSPTEHQLAIKYSNKKSRTYISPQKSQEEKALLAEIGKDKYQIISRRKTPSAPSKKATQKDLEEAKSFEVYFYTLISMMMLVGCFGFWRYDKLYKKNQLQQAQITDQQAQIAKKNDEIVRNRQQLEESHKELQRFTSITAHDLKEPLRVIQSYTQLLKRKYYTAFDDRGLEFMDFITGASTRMTKLLDDLTLYSVTGKQAFAKERIDLNFLIHDVLKELQPQIQESNAKIHLPHTPLPTVAGASAQIKQVFQHILSNAIKFRRSGVIPNIRLVSTVQETGHFIEIIDNGIGIRPEDQSRIFDVFARLHTVEEYEGTGIGLATCKKIIAQHGGQIGVTSLPGQGSVFYLTFPFDTASQEAQTKKASTNA